MIQKTINILKLILENYSFSKNKSSLVHFVKEKNPAATEHTSGIIVFEMVEDYSYWLKFAYLVWALRNKYGRFDLRWVSTRINFRHTSGLRRFITRVILENSITDKVWFKQYQALGGSLDLNFDCIKTNPKDIEEAQSIFKKIATKKDLEALELKGLRVGDLIYDTYLRYNSAPTVDLNNSELIIELIAKTLSLIGALQTYLTKVKPKLIVTSYSSYIQHGLLVRVALDLKIEVLNMGTFNQLITAPSKTFPFHRRDHFQYKTWEAALSCSTKAEEVGKKILSKRFGGEIDPSTFYMKSSAFSDVKSDDKVFKHKKRILVMGHDFFDSPHIYGQMTFPDFYEWVKYIFEHSQSSAYKIYYKPHPNSVGENTEVIESLKVAYSDVVFLDRTISNKQILDEGIDLLVTCYGTVAHEFAYHGIKVVCCGQNPHELYSFCETVLTPERLLELLLDPESIRSEIVAEDIYRFMYIHNYRLLEREYSLFPWEVSLESLDFNKLETDHVKRLGLMEKELELIRDM